LVARALPLLTTVNGDVAVDVRRTLPEFTCAVDCVRIAPCAV
jgi:hypothetical protein